MTQEIERYIMLKYNIHNIVKVIIDSKIAQSVLDSINFQIRHFNVKENEEEKCKYCIYVSSYSEYQINDKSKMSLFHDTVFDYEQIMIDPENELVIEKGENSFHIYASRSNFLINMFIHYYFIKEGYSMVHAASVEIDGKSILLPGPGGVGKTALVGYAVKHLGMRVHGDDIVLIGQQGNCLSFPRSFVLKEYHRNVYPDVFAKYGIKSNKHYGIKRFLIENAPFLPLIKRLLKKHGLQDKVSRTIGIEPHLATLSVREILGDNSIADKSLIERILFLERSTNSEFELIMVEEKEIVDRMFSIIYHEWVESFRQLFVMGSVGMLDINGMFKDTYQIIRTSVEGKKCYILKIPNNSPVESLHKQFEQYV
jgi:hypothetical protein